MPNDETSIVTDEVDLTVDGLSIDEAADLFLSQRGADEETPSDDAEETEDSNEETPDTEDVTEDEVEPEEEDTEDTEDQNTEDSDEDDEFEEVEIDDDFEIEVKVGDEDMSVSIGSLKRLAGQEAALTKRSQDFAAQRKQVEDYTLYSQTILTEMYEKQKAIVDSFSKTDLFKASREMGDEEFAQFRAEKESAETNLKFLETSMDDHVSKAREAHKAMLLAQVPETNKVLSERIPEWGGDTYRSVREYAITKGMDQEIVNNLVDPNAIEMIYKAQKFDELSAAKIKAKKKVKKIIKAPKKVMKKSTKETPKGTPNVDALRKKATETGDIDDITALFLAQRGSE